MRVRVERTASSDTPTLSNTSMMPPEDTAVLRPSTWMPRKASISDCAFAVCGFAVCGIRTRSPSMLLTPGG
jgi:hypothetical protein